jgi:hypothetical protein
MVLPEALRMVGGVYRRRRLAVPTLVVFGRRDWPYTEKLKGGICRNPEQLCRSPRVIPHQDHGVRQVHLGRDLQLGDPKVGRTGAFGRPVDTGQSTPVDRAPAVR